MSFLTEIPTLDTLTENVSAQTKKSRAKSTAPIHPHCDYNAVSIVRFICALFAQYYNQNVTSDVLATLDPRDYPSDRVTSVDIASPYAMLLSKIRIAHASLKTRVFDDLVFCSLSRVTTPKKHYTVTIANDDTSKPIPTFDSELHFTFEPPRCAFIPTSSPKTLSKTDTIDDPKTDHFLFNTVYLSRLAIVAYALRVLVDYHTLKNVCVTTNSTTLKKLSSIDNHDPVLLVSYHDTPFSIVFKTCDLINRFQSKTTALIMTQHVLSSISDIETLTPRVFSKTSFDTFYNHPVNVPAFVVTPTPKKSKSKSKSKSPKK